MDEKLTPQQRRARRHYELHKEKIKARSKARYDTNKEEINQQRKDKLSCPKAAEARRAYYRERRKNNRQRESDIKSANKYGISIEEVQRLRSVPNCEICGDELQHYQQGGAAIDHCHETGKVRGIICAHCNRGLGSFRDNPAALQQAILYLEERS